MSEKVLITFLGAAPKTSSDSYSMTTYDLGEGKYKATRFLGLALAKHLAVDRVIIVGTSGSMWDVLLLEQDVADLDEDLFDQLHQAVEFDAVTDALLSQLETAFSESAGLLVSPALIPYATEREETQLEIVGKIAELLTDASTVHMDITHSFRHLPIISLAATQIIQATGAARIGNIYYGAFQSRTEDNVTPVVKLSQLVETQQWLKAFNAYEHSQDYGVFVPLLEGGMDSKAVKQLRLAAYHERINRTGRARSLLREFNKALQSYQPESPLERMFIAQLEKRFEWMTGGILAERQLELARLHHKKSDFLRAAILCLEAWISARVYATGKASTSYEDREEAKTALRKKSAFRLLNQLRNAMAHDTWPDTKNAQRILDSPEEMKRTLEDSLGRVAQYLEQIRADRA